MIRGGAGTMRCSEFVPRFGMGVPPTKRDTRTGFRCAQDRPK